MKTGKLHNKINIEVDYTVPLYYCGGCTPEEVTCAGCAIMKILKATFLDMYPDILSGF